MVPLAVPVMMPVMPVMPVMTVMVLVVMPGRAAMGRPGFSEGDAGRGHGEDGEPAGEADSGTRREG
jgi:hypothetical protein